VVKGKTQPVAIHEVLDYHTEESYPQLIDALGYFRDGLAKYRHGLWNDAQALFSQVLSLNPADKSAKLYVERCRHLAENPPAEGWNGVWVMENK
jgi:adenylate cyclase